MLTTMSLYVLIPSLVLVSSHSHTLTPSHTHAGKGIIHSQSDAHYDRGTN